MYMINLILSGLCNYQFFKKYRVYRWYVEPNNTLHMTIKLEVKFILFELSFVYNKNIHFLIILQIE